MFFWDGVSRIDMVLAYEDDGDEPDEDEGSCIQSAVAPLEFRFKFMLN